jgi:hypothetical protein
MTVLKEVAAWLQGTYDKRTRVVHGARAGVPVAVRFILRGTGYERTSHDRRWTEIDAKLPKGYALSLYVRRREWTDTLMIERNAMVDIEIGDREFNRQFLVEAAPAQVARKVLGGTVRSVLAAHDTVCLTTDRIDDRAVVRMSIRTWLTTPAITRAVDALGELSASLRDAYAALDAAALVGTGAPYRPELDDTQVLRQRSALEDEVAFVAELRAKR